eukprot:TRINITY_DN7621_c1_g1_i7.p1 TRINITY_DN7621_c1_g1~~TRINITY_DN7621_c1_g1_i7.p1  ORF type:complete len:216 (-),score=37.11 TRINITY_DN7621_c1_g1_i7:972-1619(-)
MAFLAAGGMGSLLGQLQQVGLQLLVNPSTSTPVMMGACALSGVVYPTYASFKAMESKKVGDDIQWLNYWTIYGSVSLAEHYTDDILGWFPWYYHAKFAMFLWLQLPQTRGAEYIYTKFYRPYFLKYQEKIDLVLEWWMTRMAWMLDTPMAKMLYAQIGIMFMQVYKSVTWFLEDPAKQQKDGTPKIVDAELAITDKEQKKDDQNQENKQISNNGI